MWCKLMRWQLVVGLLTMFMAGPVQGELEFGIPTPVPPPFNLDGGYGYPTLSADGLDIHFVSDRPYYAGDYTTGWFDIWTSHRDSLTDPWQPFVNFGEPINTPELTEIGPSFTADGEELYFMRSLSPFSLPEGDLFVSYRQPDASWGIPQALVDLNTSEVEAYPTISPDGLTLYFNTFNNSNYPSPTGTDFNMFVSHRAEPQCSLYRRGLLLWRLWYGLTGRFDPHFSGLSRPCGVLWRS